MAKIYPISALRLIQGFGVPWKTARHYYVTELALLFKLLPEHTQTPARVLYHWGRRKLCEKATRNISYVHSEKCVTHYKKNRPPYRINCKGAYWWLFIKRDYIYIPEWQKIYPISASYGSIQGCVFDLWQVITTMPPKWFIIPIVYTTKIPRYWGTFSIGGDFRT